MARAMGNELSQQDLDAFFYGRQADPDAEFFVHTTCDVKASIDAGSRIMMEVDYVRLSHPKQNVSHCRAVNEKDKTVYADKWKKFQQEKSDVRSRQVEDGSRCEPLGEGFQI